eukprot:8628181-Alexandrium_andersonii.AAC.1
MLSHMPAAHWCSSVPVDIPLCTTCSPGPHAVFRLMHLHAARMHASALAVPRSRGRGRVQHMFNHTTYAV